MFNGEYAGELPPHRSFDHAIHVVEGEEPPWGPTYALSEKVLEVLRECLENMLRSGKICPCRCSNPLCAKEGGLKSTFVCEL